MSESKTKQIPIEIYQQLKRVALADPGCSVYRPEEIDEEVRAAFLEIADGLREMMRDYLLSKAG